MDNPKIKMEQLTHKSVVASYEMYDITDGNEILLEATPEDQPLKLMTDFGMMPIAPLEEILKETASGESYEIVVTPENAFGEYVAERVIELDKATFTIDGVFDEVHIRPGAIIPLQNEEGQRFMAQVLEVGDDKVKLDLNHPLAGKTLKFKGTVIDSHEASEDEVMALLNAMHSHGGCGGCGGGGCSGNCGSCGGDCGGDCGGECSGDCNCNK